MLHPCPKEGPTSSPTCEKIKVGPYFNFLRIVHPTECIGKCLKTLAKSKDEKYVKKLKNEIFQKLLDRYKN